MLSHFLTKNKIKLVMSLIVICNPKGGTGKSTLVCLLVEYFNYLNQPIKLIDVDPNQAAQDWITECSKEGRNLSTSNSFIHQIIDTAGISGSALPYLNKADLIIVPFQPQIFDLKITANWIAKITTLNPAWLGKLVFIVNRWQNTKDQRDAVHQLQELLAQKQFGLLCPFYLSNRPATYSAFLEGKPFNFFSQKPLIIEESKRLMEYLNNLLNNYEKNIKSK